MRNLSREMRRIGNRYESPVQSWIRRRTAGNTGRLAPGLARVAVWAAPLVLAFAVACLTPAKAQDAPVTSHDIVAVIEGEPIPTGEFEAYFRSYLRRKLYHGGSEEQVRALRSDALDQLILERLVAREIEQRGIRGDPEAVEQRIKVLEQRYGTSDRWAAVQQNLPVLRRHLLADSRAAVLRSRIEEVADPSEEELLRFYDDNPVLFTEPVAWEVAVILVGVPPSAASEEWRTAEIKSRDLYERLLAGDDFAALAAAHSTHESATSAGAMGLVHKGQLAPEVEAALEEISVGQATPPIKVLEGYAVFRKLAARPARVQPFSSVMDRARSLYLRERKKAKWDHFTRDLRANAQITIYKHEDAAKQEGANPPK